uniref:Uncharacterized protein n=1 Tax=Octopus bimaculoides TaxID=37653 RepID=A0A0L8HF96_OCTBM
MFIKKLIAKHLDLFWHILTAKSIYLCFMLNNLNQCSHFVIFSHQSMYYNFFSSSICFQNLFYIFISKYFPLLENRDWLCVCMYIYI